MKRVVSLFFVILMLFAACFQMSSCKAKQPDYGNKVGDRCFAIELEAYNGRETFSIEENFGKVTVLNFWATWCRPCVTEITDEFPRVTKAYGDKVSIVAVHITTRSTDVQNYIHTYFPHHNIIFCQDKEMTPNDGGYYYNLTGGEGYVPYTLILDGNGVIVEKIVGGTDYDTLKEIIDEILEEQ